MSGKTEGKPLLPASTYLIINLFAERYFTMFAPEFIVDDRAHFKCLSPNSNPNIIDILEKNLDRVNWVTLSGNTNAIPLLEKTWIKYVGTCYQ